MNYEKERREELDQAIFAKYEKLGKNQRAGDAQSFDLQDFHELNAGERRSFVKEYLNNGHTLAELLLHLGLSDKNNWDEGNAKLKELINTISYLAKDFNTDIQRELYNLFDGDSTNDGINNNEDGDTTRQIQRLFLDNCTSGDLKNIIKDALNEMKKRPLPNSSSIFLENLLKNDRNNKAGVIIEELGFKGWANEREQIGKLSPDRANNFNLIREFGLQKYNKAADGSVTISRADIRLLTGKERENLYCDIIAKFPDPRAQTLLTDLIAQGLLDGLSKSSLDNFGAANIRKVNTAGEDNKQVMASAIASALENGINRGIEAGVYPQTATVDIPDRDAAGNSFYIMVYDNMFCNDVVAGVSHPRDVATKYFGEFQNSNLFQGINQLVDDDYDKAVKSAREIVNAKEIKTAPKAEASVHTAQADEDNKAYRDALSTQISIKEHDEPDKTYYVSSTVRPLGYNVVAAAAARSTPTSFPGDINKLITSPYSCDYQSPPGVSTISYKEAKYEINNESLVAVVLLMNAGYKLDGITADQIKIKDPDGLTYTIASKIENNGPEVIVTGSDGVKYQLTITNNSITSVKVSAGEDSLEYNITDNDEHFNVIFPDGYTIKSDSEMEFSFDLPDGVDVEKFKETAIYFVSATRDGDSIGNPTPADVRKALKFMQGLANIDFNVQIQNGNKESIEIYMERVTAALESVFVELGVPPRGADPNNKNWLDIMLGPKDFSSDYIDNCPGHFLCRTLKDSYKNADNDGNVKTDNLLNAAHNICTSQNGQQELFRNNKSLLMCESIHVYNGSERAAAEVTASRISSGQFGDSAAFKNFALQHQGNNGPLLLAAAIYGLGKNPPPTGLPEISLQSDKGTITGIKFKSASGEFILSIDGESLNDNNDYKLLLAELRFLESIKEGKNFEKALAELKKQFEENSTPVPSYVRTNPNNEGRVEQSIRENTIENIRENALSRMRDYADTHSMQFSFAAVPE
ncbi:hypothetical protein NO1_0022 [Candidatus Termititenax aidoneus]|uniref:Uncharacterized protein n=1 Tax=Termititenax aidoneus TaxID=2218524 RepID=A0A388T8H8_TERA1|nr:hypothetical protein NO1_0022 [Candidatus Termititenax aidoneus]